MQWLGIASGVFWLITYLLLIKRGYQDKACGMPMAALALNISWEFIFSFVHPHGGIQLIINIAWFALDSIIVFQYLRYESARRPSEYVRRIFLRRLSFHTRRRIPDRAPGHARVR